MTPAYHDGYRAFESGLNRDQNPKRQGSEEFRERDWGWRNAQQVYRCLAA